MQENILSAIKDCPALRQADAQALADIAQLVVYNKGDTIMRDKDKTENLYFVIEGIVSLYKLNMYGSKKSIFILGKGKPFNENILCDQRTSIFAQAMTPVTLLSFPHQALKEYLLSDAQTTLLLMASMSLKIRRLYHQLKNTCKSYRLDKQIGSKLWKLTRDFGISYPVEQHPSSLRINFKISINELSELMGSTRESVSRSLKILVDKNLIFIKNGYFFVIDIEELRKYSMHPQVQ